MSIAFEQLNTLEGFKAFLSAYHGQLSDTRSFPPLGLQKALHTAAPVFGYNDWHVMSAALGNVPAASTAHAAAPAPEPIRIVTVTVTDINNDDNIQFVDTYVYRTWEEAKALVVRKLAERLINTATSEDDFREINDDVRGVTYPDDEWINNPDHDLDAYIDWIEEHNDIDALIEFINQVDHGQTLITCKETWI